MQIDFAVDKSLMSSKAKNPKAVKALLDLNNVEFDGDKIKGLEEQVKNIKKSDSYLFIVYFIFIICPVWVWFMFFDCCFYSFVITEFSLYMGKIFLQL